jgi:hypothetical protein
MGDGQGIGHGNKLAAVPEGKGGGNRFQVGQQGEQEGEKAEEIVDWFFIEGYVSVHGRFPLKR